MRNFKKLMAIVLAGTMILGSSVVAFADDVAEGTGTGTGDVEGVITTDVFQVVVPTDAGSTFNFTLDPQQLIKATAEEGKGTTDKYDDDATLFFKNEGDTAETSDDTYSATSDEITVTNKSTMDVDVTVSATISDHTGITLTEDKTFANDTSASLYMALVGNDGQDQTAAITSNGASLTSKIAKTADTYEVVWVAEAEKEVNGETVTVPAHYEYQLKSDATGFKEYTFKLTGACNTSGDWTGLEEAAPKVTVVWNIVPTKGDLPVFAASTDLGVITITSKGTSKNALKSITSIMMTNPDTNKTYDGYKALEGYWSAATTTDTTITFDTKFVEFYKSQATTEATITYVTEGGETKTAKVNVVTQETTSEPEVGE